MRNATDRMVIKSKINNQQKKNDYHQKNQGQRKQGETRSKKNKKKRENKGDVGKENEFTSTPNETSCINHAVREKGTQQTLNDVPVHDDHFSR